MQSQQAYIAVIPIHMYKGTYVFLTHVTATIVNRSWMSQKCMLFVHMHSSNVYACCCSDHLNYTLVVCMHVCMRVHLRVCVCVCVCACVRACNLIQSFTEHCTVIIGPLLIQCAILLAVHTAT